jgi:hypothetical protein
MIGRVVGNQPWNKSYHIGAVRRSTEIGGVYNKRPLA